MHFLITHKHSLLVRDAAVPVLITSQDELHADRKCVCLKCIQFLLDDWLLAICANATGGCERCLGYGWLCVASIYRSLLEASSSSLWCGRDAVIHTARFREGRAHVSRMHHNAETDNRRKKRSVLYRKMRNMMRRLCVSNTLFKFFGFLLLWLSHDKRHVKSLTNWRVSEGVGGSDDVFSVCSTDEVECRFGGVGEIMWWSDL